jgi:twitching motility protein PilT
VISQRLAPKVGGGRYALLEMMGSNLRTKDTIVHGESEGKSFYEIIEASHTFGWRNFDQACLEAYEQGFITEESAGLYCTKRGVVTRNIDKIKKQRGEATSTSDLQMRKDAHGPAKPSAPSLPATFKLKT